MIYSWPTIVGHDLLVDGILVVLLIMFFLSPI